MILTKIIHVPQCGETYTVCAESDRRKLIGRGGLPRNKEAEEIDRKVDFYIPDDVWAADDEDIAHHIWYTR